MRRDIPARTEVVCDRCESTIDAKRGPDTRLHSDRFSRFVKMDFDLCKPCFNDLDDFMRGARPFEATPTLEAD